MPVSKDWRRYPAEFLRIIQQLAPQPEKGYRWQMNTYSSATHYRQQMNGFLRAITSLAQEAGPLTAQEYNVALAIKMKIHSLSKLSGDPSYKMKPCEIVVEHADWLEDLQPLREQLGQSPLPEAGSEPAPSQEPSSSLGHGEDAIAAFMRGETLPGQARTATEERSRASIHTMPCRICGSDTQRNPAGKLTCTNPSCPEYQP